MADNLTDAGRAKRAMEAAFQADYEAKWPDANFELVGAGGALDPDRQEFFARYIEQQQQTTEPELTPHVSEIDEDEQRRAGRGGGGINPANATHSLNIRPDVGEGPAGLEVYTTMKSKDYPATSEAETGVSEPGNSGREERKEPPPTDLAQNPETVDRSEPSQPFVDEFEADLAAALAHTRDDESQREQATLRASEENAKRQNTECAARAGEDVPGEPDSFAADLRAAAKAAKLEREGEGQELTFRDQADTGQAADTGGGRGLF